MKIDLQTKKPNRIIYKIIIIIISFLFQLFIASLALECHPNNALYTLLLFFIYLYLNTLIVGKFFDNQDKKYNFFIKEHIGFLLFLAFSSVGLISQKGLGLNSIILQRDLSFWSIPAFVFLKFYKKRYGEIKAIVKIRLIGGVMALLGIATILSYHSIKIRIGEGFIWYFLEGSVVWGFFGIGILLRNNICRVITIIYSIGCLILMVASIIITRGNYPARFLVIFILLILLIRLLMQKNIKIEFKKGIRGLTK